jgi:hypothetical protein
MGKHSNIGPVDPQINGLPAYGVVAELERAYNEMIADPRKQFVWNPILSRYTPSFVQQCQWSIERSKMIIAEFLEANMFSGLPEAERKVKVAGIVEQLSRANRGHDAHIHFEECEAIGLNVKRLEDDPIQDLVLTIHHCFMFALSNSGAFKIIENHLGRRYVKTQVFPQLPAMNLPPALVDAMMKELETRTVQRTATEVLSRECLFQPTTRQAVSSLRWVIWPSSDEPTDHIDRGHHNGRGDSKRKHHSRGFVHNATGLHTFQRRGARRSWLPGRRLHPGHGQPCGPCPYRW